MNIDMSKVRWRIALLVLGCYLFAWLVTTVTGWFGATTLVLLGILLLAGGMYTGFSLLDGDNK